MGLRDDESGARQDRILGQGRTRVVPGRTGPAWSEAMGLGRTRVVPGRTGPGSSRGAQKKRKQQLWAMCTPERARGTGQRSSTEGPSLKKQFYSTPASDERVGQGAQVF